MSEEIRKPLTDAQRRVYDCIAQHLREHGYPPTVREIGRALGIRSTNAVSDHLAALERKGYIESSTFRARAIRLKVVECSAPAREGDAASLEEAHAILQSLEGVAPVDDPTSPLAIVLRLARGYVALAEESRVTTCAMREAVVRRYVERRETLEAIARDFGRSVGWARDVLEAEGVKRRSRGRPRLVDTPAMRADVVQRYERGESIEAIANAHQRGIKWAWDVLDAAGVKRRPQGRPRKSAVQAAQAAA